MYNGRKVYAIVLAAGSGRRMHSKTKKQFMEILGKPLFSWSASRFEHHPARRSWRAEWSATSPSSND